ncbi:unnamed protein product, partial [Prorocentrum cordatum]
MVSAGIVTVQAVPTSWPALPHRPGPLLTAPPPSGGAAPGSNTPSVAGLRTVIDLCKLVGDTDGIAKSNLDEAGEVYKQIVAELAGGIIAPPVLGTPPAVPPKLLKIEDNVSCQAKAFDPIDTASLFTVDTG